MRKLIQSAGFDPAVARHRASLALVSTSLRALGATFELVSERSPELQAELARWDEGRRVSMGVLPDGPRMTIQHTGGRIRFVGMRLEQPDVAMYFKNLDAAVMIFTGQVGAHTASVEKRVVVHGNITAAMQVMRAMGIVQKLLMPGAVLRRTCKNPPQLTSGELLIKARVLAGLTPRLLATFARR